MLQLLVKALVSGVLVMAASEVARRHPGPGALISALPLVSVLAMVWLWRDNPDAVRMADFSRATFWFVVPSLPMFLLIPALLQRGAGFWAALAAGCVLTMALFAGMLWLGPRFGLKL